MSRWLSLLPLGLLLALAVYFALGLGRDPRQLGSVLIDRPVPAFDLPAFGKSEKRVRSSDLTGRVTLLNIFASWCVACRVEHPVLARISAGGVNVVGLAWKDKADDLNPWLEELGNPYAAIADDANGRTAIDLGVTGAPETYVIDAKGRIRYKHTGPIDDHVWKETLEPLVRKLGAES